MTRTFLHFKCNFCHNNSTQSRNIWGTTGGDCCNCFPEADPASIADESYGGDFLASHEKGNQCLRDKLNIWFCWEVECENEFCWEVEREKEFCWEKESETLSFVDGKNSQHEAQVISVQAKVHWHLLDWNCGDFDWNCCPLDRNCGDFDVGVTFISCLLRFGFSLISTSSTNGIAENQATELWAADTYGGIWFETSRWDENHKFLVWNIPACWPFFSWQALFVRS